MTMVVVSHEMGFARAPPTAWSSWTMGIVERRAARRRSSAARGRTGPAPSSARSNGMYGAPIAIVSSTASSTSGSRAGYLPKIIDGFWLTIQLAVCIILTGLAAGAAAGGGRSFGLRPLNWLIIFTVDLFRALPPLVCIALLYFGLPAAGLSLGPASPSPGCRCRWC